VKNTNGKIVLAHCGFFDYKCREKYRENSKEVCELATKKDYVDIIELDVRKSKDGIIYCYHGNWFFYNISSKFPKDFSTLKQKYNVDSLKDVLSVIIEDKIIFLDIKDTNVTREDILSCFKNKKLKKIILGNKSPSYLKRFYSMPNNFVKIFNGNIFCKFYNLKKLKKDNFRYFEVVFPFQISNDIIKKTRDNSPEFRCASLFFKNKKSYFKKINKYNVKHITSDFL